MIPMYGCCAGSNVILRLDDPDLTTDEGTAIDVEFIVQDSAGVGGLAHMRRIEQSVSLTGTATVKIAPVFDGQADDSQEETFTLSASDGLEQFLPKPVDSLGRRFGFRVRVTALTGSIAFGAHDRKYINRRSQR